MAVKNLIIEVYGIQHRADLKLGLAISERAIEVEYNPSIIIRGYSEEEVDSHEKVLRALFEADHIHLSDVLEKVPSKIWIDGEEVSRELFENLYKEYFEDED